MEKELYLILHELYVLYAFLYKCLSVYTQVDDGNEHTHIPPSSWCHLKSHAPHTDRRTEE